MTEKQNRFSEETLSIWRDTVHLPAFSPLKGECATDVLVVGAGITGITTAYMLAKRGVQVTLIDASKLASGTTGYTTAKISAQHGLIYDHLIRSMGEEKAALYYQANKEGLHWIGNHVKENDLHCDFNMQPSILYATSDKEAQDIEKEKKAYDQLGILGTLTDSVALPFAVKNALIMPGQAQFHPLMYLHELIAELVKMNVPIYEETLAETIEEKETERQVKTKNGSISCQHVLICSHFPFYDYRFYFARMFPELSYLLACETDGALPDGMYLSAGNPKRSIRGLHLNQKDYLLIGGENHKTGRGESMERHYERLADFAEKQFGQTKIVAHWSAQDFTTLDQVPYIGRMTKNNPHILVAAGFHKWGMTTSTIAAQILTDIVLEQANPYLALFSPSRFEATSMLASFLVENLQVAGQLIKGKLSRPVPLSDELQNDQAVIAELHGERVGAYRNEKGELTVFDTTCPHLGCEVNWNEGEKSWDCPCHGSRFKASGEIIDGPAKDPLKLFFSEAGHEKRAGNKE